MALDPVPWLIAGGAVHSSEICRVLPYVAAGGAQGVAAFPDCTVRALAAPGAAVVVGPGAFGILNTYAGQTTQTYMGRAISDTNLPIAATGASVRSDMIIMRIDDPYYGGSTPPSIPDGPYVKLEVLSNVGAGATALPGSVTYPALMLARIDIPASTSVITSAMIVNLRKLIRPRKERTALVYQSDVARTMTTVWPATQNWPEATPWSIVIPPWATQVIAIAHMAGIVFSVPDGKCATLIKLGTDANSVQTQYTAFSTTGNSGASRENLLTAGTLAIPPAYRGTTQEVAICGGVVEGSGLTRPVSNDGSTTVLDLEFVEAPVAT